MVREKRNKKVRVERKNQTNFHHAYKEADEIVERERFLFTYFYC